MLLRKDSNNDFYFGTSDVHALDEILHFARKRQLAFGLNLIIKYH